ncbi:MAG: hypothetical protein MJK04_07435, partial [Psychrosphaera sp.]|nr:hypothetical protein [Psychrosphaera sp.]
IKRLCEIYGHTYADNRTKIWISSIAGGYTSAYVGRGLLMSWLKVIPGMSLATSASAGVVTYALGLLFRRHFNNGGTPDTVDVKAMKTQFKDDLQTAGQHIDGQDESVVSTQTQQDDLTLIEGIGPKTQDLLGESHIQTFKQLAETPVNDLQAMLDAGGSRFKLCHPDTWPEQAQLASDQHWQALDELKLQLKGGRRSS